MNDRDAEALVEGLLQEMAATAPPVRVVTKAVSGTSGAIDGFLRAVTLGGQDRYLTDYVTTLGRTILVPDGWGRMWALRRYAGAPPRAGPRAAVRALGLGWGWCSSTGSCRSRAGLAWGRARLEWEAYAERRLRATAEFEGIEAARDPRLHAEIVGRFTGPDYAWDVALPEDGAGGGSTPTSQGSRER